jgi:hypothetical protein
MRGADVMRLIYAFCFVVVMFGIVARLKPETLRGPSRTPTQAATAPAAPAIPASRKPGAANAIRSTSVAPPSAGKSPSPAPPPTPAKATTGAADAQSDAASAPGEPTAKPALELFSGFVDDDPKNVFLPPSVQYHAAVESETVDPAWGPAAADALRGYLTSRFGDRFELPLVDCRQDLCELRVAGQVGGDQITDMHDIQEAVRLMRQEPWWTALEFDQDTGLIGTATDGRALLLWFFSRK